MLERVVFAAALALVLVAAYLWLKRAGAAAALGCRVLGREAVRVE